MSNEPPLLRCPLWQSIVETEPRLVEVFEASVKESNRFVEVFRGCVDLPVRDFRLAEVKHEEGTVLSPDAARALSFPAGGRPYLFHHLAAMPFVVTPGVCDRGEGGEMHMRTGALLALTDMLTSFHVWVVNFPQPAQHVSISLQCNACKPLVAGRQYIAISQIDRLGNRIVYTSMEFIEANWPPHAPPPSSLDTLPKLREALRHCEVVVNAKHTKSIIPSNGLKRIVEPATKTESETAK
ncbi:unnamed protein product [Phytomonas sp. EM1]|nr:unnamed protein product [Phytomonas sp. EM1]|eukprot:CCW63792.1 unnamed protein product [Phytomonas sp. isolate EM1]